MNEDLFCHDLPSRPKPNEIGTVLVTGASGYIGGRLIPELLARGYKVRAMVRSESPEYKTRWPDAEIAVADALVINQLQKVLQGIDTAYYLIHSLNLGVKEFEAADMRAATNFRKAAEQAHVKRIIYLGGLGDIRGPLSSHLENRMKVAEELRRGSVSVTILRAAIIIGSGSASYEIIQDLVRNLPILIIPHWAKNKCQPIAIRDVIKYLVGVLEISQTVDKDFDIGGRAVITYERMLKVLSILLNKKRIFLPSPISKIWFYAYFASLLTRVPNAITQCLMEGLKNKVICQENSIREFLPFQPISYKEAVVRAMSREEQDRVSTRWSDAYPPAHELALKLSDLKGYPAYTAYYSLLTDKEASLLFRSFCKIGGKEGWFNSNWMWRLRGLIDRMFLGVGHMRGRKSYSGLKINDVIDFWRIEDLRKDERLLLRAEMKLSGWAWLEFHISQEEGKRRLSIISYYHTRTFIGTVYWYIFYPFHEYVFHKLIKDIEKRS